MKKIVTLRVAEISGATTPKLCREIEQAKTYISQTFQKNPARKPDSEDN